MAKKDVVLRAILKASPVTPVVRLFGRFIGEDNVFAPSFAVLLAAIALLWIVTVGLLLISNAVTFDEVHTVLFFLHCIG